MHSVYHTVCYDEPEQHTRIGQHLSHSPSLK